MNEIKKIDLPAMPFYVGDWLKCPEVRALPPDYRGLWFDMICYMWESTERGVMVKPNGKPYTDNEIIRMVGLDNQNSGFWLTSLLENGVCKRRESDGAIYSKRMVRDEEIRRIRRLSGSKGGNPILLDNQSKDILDNHMDNQKVIQNTENEIEYINENNIYKEGAKKKNVPPTLEEVKAYCLERKNSVDPNKWFNFYEAKGWMIGKNKMKDWKAAVRTWEENNNKSYNGSNKQAGKQGNYISPSYEYTTE